MKKYLRVHEVAEQLKVSPSTIRRYVNEGLLKSDLTPFGHRVFTREQVRAFRNEEEPAPRIVAYYARASDGDMNRVRAQFDLLEQAHGKPDYAIHDRASGLNDNRKGLARLFALSREGKITDVYATHPDRLTRFGLAYLEEVFSLGNVRLHFLDDNKVGNHEEELLRDFMSLLASFSGKFYPLRGRAQQRQLLDKAGGVLNEAEKDS